MPNPYVEVRNGGYYLAGSRVSLDSIVAFHFQGETVEQLADAFSRPVDQIRGALEFYLSNQEAVDRSIAEAQERFETWKAQQPPLPESLRKRLDAARTQIQASQG